jgi:hypothetical protein
VTLTYIKWRDASYHDASDSPKPVVELAEMVEVGLLIAETDEAVMIGMEYSADGTHPGRWRATIPKVNIVDRKDVSLLQAFGLGRPPRKSRGPRISKARPAEPTVMKDETPA